MAMTNAGLGAAIKTEISAVITIADSAQLDLVANAIGKAVVAYLKANAVVMPTALVSAVAGSPVTGTGTIT